MNQADIGKIAEAQFVRDALMRGDSPALPWSGQTGYDIILTNRRGSFRVQIKSCSRWIQKKPTHRPRYSVELRGPVDGTGKRTRQAGYDFLAVWFPREAKWVFLSAKKVKSTRALHIRLNEGIARNLDNWEIFSK